MRVLQIGGIFGQTAEFRAKNLQTTTETLLVDHLPEHGIEVTSQAHAFRNDFRRVDLVHVHHLANSCVPLMLHKPVPLVFTRHFLGDVPLARRTVLTAINARADALVALSDVEAERLRRRRVGKGRVVRIYNGVASDVFTTRSRHPSVGGQPWTLLFVGQLIPLKRAEIAVRTVASLVGAGHDVHLRFVSHRPTLEPELRAQATGLGIGDRVHFLGAMEQREVADAMRAAHALLLTSETESLPTVVTEAVLTATPVLTFDVGGVREQLPAGVLPPHVADVEGFLRSAHDLLADYPRVADLYADHRPAAEQTFSITAMVQAHADLYRDLLDGGPRAR